jgi:hypothetical protein
MVDNLFIAGRTPLFMPRVSTWNNLCVFSRVMKDFYSKHQHVCSMTSKGQLRQHFCVKLSHTTCLQLAWVVLCKSSTQLVYVVVAYVVVSRAGKKIFLPGSTTWRQKFPADQRSIFVLNLHVHKHIVF